MTEPTAPIRVEARGVLCPVPIIRLARTAGAAPPGALIELLSDDPAAAHDVPAWCRLRGHTLLSVEVCDEAPSGLRVDGPAVASGAEPEVGRPEATQPLRHLIRLEVPGPGG